MNIKDKIEIMVDDFIRSGVGITILTIMLIIGTILVCSLGMLKTDKYTWNDGVCISCGVGHYEYEGTEATRNGIYYIYSCDKCGHHEAFFKDMK